MFPDLTRDDVFRIETRHLWLRWPRASDVGDFARLASDKAVAEMTTCLPHPFGSGEAEDFVIGSRRVNLEGRGLVLALSPHSDPADLIGLVGLQVQDDSARSLMLGYWLGRPFWGRRLMTEAVAAIMDMAFMLTDAKHVHSPVRQDNAAALKVLDRCGFPLPDLSDGANRFATATIGRGAWLEARSSAADRIQVRGPASLPAV
jgi:RimJ/RimL family protein N-acetyltransferase